MRRYRTIADLGIITKNMIEVRDVPDYKIEEEGLLSPNESPLFLTFLQASPFAF